MFLIDAVMQQQNMSEFEARGVILEGHILLNGEVCTSVKTKVSEKDAVVCTYKKNKYVTRSGLKLEEALRVFQVNAEGRICLDIGASEGGFTDCLLQHGAAKVYAVDVAYGILNWKLRTDDRVVPIERMNARYLSEKEVPEKCDLITSDVSFISIRKILPGVTNLLRKDGLLLCLFKPQFELKKHLLGKNGIALHYEDVAESICTLIEDFRTQGIFITGFIPSPVRGNHGNIEFLLRAVLQESDTVDATHITEIVKEVWPQPIYSNTISPT